MTTPAAVQTRRRRFSVDDYHRMIDLGILGSDHKVELIDGEVVYKAGREPVEYVGPVGGVAYRFTRSEVGQLLDAGLITRGDEVDQTFAGGEIMPIGPAHSHCVDWLNFLLNRLLAGRAIVRVQNPVVLEDSEPEPDISVIPFRPGAFAASKPRATDVLVIVEVADSSIEEDLGRKANLYATNLVREYWVVDLVSRAIVVHRGPDRDGTWSSVESRVRGSVVEIEALTGSTISVDDILPQHSP